MPCRRRKISTEHRVQSFHTLQALEVCKREAFIQDLPNSFAAELCTFALDLLGPICSPPYCNSQCYLKRKRKSNGPGPSSSHRRRRIKGPSSELDSTTEEASEIDELSGNESNTSGACESDSDALVVIEEDLQDESKSGVEESDISPDLRPNKFNLALLGNFWSYSAVVKQLLRIVFTCLVCQRYATAASVERLVACAVPAEIKGSKLSLYPAKHPMDITACIPHWCIKWLIRQVADAVGQNSGNQAIIDRFCRNLLDVCLRGPHRNGGCEYARFWAITGLANLVYVGIYFPDQLRASLTLWLEEKFAELERGSKSSSNLIHVLAPLVVLCPKDPATSDRYPQNGRCLLYQLMSSHFSATSTESSKAICHERGSRISLPRIPFHLSVCSCAGIYCYLRVHALYCSHHCTQISDSALR